MQMWHQRGNFLEFLESTKTSYTKKNHWPYFPVDWKLSSVISGFTILVPTSILLVLEQLPLFDLPKAIFHLQILSSSPVLESLSEWTRNFAPLHLCHWVLNFCIGLTPFPCLNQTAPEPERMAESDSDSDSVQLSTNNKISRWVHKGHNGICGSRKLYIFFYLLATLAKSWVWVFHANIPLWIYYIYNII